MGESCVGLKEGDTLTLEQALTGLMVMSGNDVATAIATHVGGKIDPASADPYGTFIKAMNDRAAQLGCTDTLFENPPRPRLRRLGRQSAQHRARRHAHLGRSVAQ